MNEPPAASMPIIQQKCKNLGVALYRVEFKTNPLIYHFQLQSCFVKGQSFSHSDLC